MSKSPNIFLPALGVTGIVLGAAYGLNTRSYKADEAAMAMEQAQLAEARAAEATEAAAARAAAAEEAAAAELAAKNEEMESRIAKIQQEAMAKAADAGGLIREPAPDRAGGYGLGRVALAEEIAAWDVDVLPDGRGLPEGSGDALVGEEVFAEKCAACHGDFAEGVDNWPVLAGGFDTLADKDPVKTVGSYWPYLSTVWDYVHRSMPFGAAGTLSADDTYAIVAYILYSNDLIDDDFVLSNENFAEFEMYNANGFIIDDRAETEYPEWRTEPCMENCKDSVEITMRASVLDVTPDEGADDDAMEEEASAAPAMADTAEDTATDQAPEGTDMDAGTGVATAQVPAVEEAPEVAALDAELVAAGEKVFRKCKACHQVGEGAENKSGPQLNGVMGRVIGSVDGFKYSKVLTAAGEEGLVWDETSMNAFLESPRGYFKGTKMSFSGLKKEADRAAVTEYLKSFNE